MSACPACLKFDSRVLMTRRLRNGWVRRYRTCQQEACTHRWSTVEIPLETIEEGIDPEGMKEIRPHREDM